MPRRLRIFYSVLTASLLLIPLVALYSELSKRPDIWWTPPAMAVSLAESRDRVEIYARGRPLDTLVAQGQVSITDGAGSRLLRAEEIGIRFNNGDRVRVQRLPRTFPTPLRHRLLPAWPQTPAWPAQRPAGG